ncbi:MAG: ring-hydroxylating dioxygenase ferredoxin reductase family protein [Methylobacterium sp.]|nr:ring-hydroxylating dioxygenase ferredoxin reductase family protein [Methylobacterium sp.]MCA3655519.1 ring-hydroxylating dioxygenase ferredoxin reductase family protein [Methylobacterium sp.]MCA3657319.1 ring-hydroxylating dioxygenase ferredoxin reductase family protein [Methylobacterium sp.]MCA3661971.1 ring-hydroxylating dioxygenase ferredoxin reductase family protein [Methylobacterium sp.]MCA3662341.1 ring-hydroxylating dioxygenase ferredoxin reductase family protein [Methylobacterium sp.
MHRIALNFEDGVTRFIEARADELVADAAYRVGVNIPMDCRDGACGTCKCQCESGDYSLGSYIEDAMTEDEAREGFVLTCQMKAKSDCVIRIPAASTACKVKPAAMAAEMVEVRQLSPTSIGFAVRVKDAGQLSYLPGQYVNVSVPGTSQTRSYSFSSMPREGVVEFLVRNIPNGLMSSYLAGSARPGDALTLTGPIGSFYLRDVTRPLLFLAGGTGLAPFLAMLESLRHKETGQPIHMIYGVTNDADLVELDKLAAFAAAIPGFTYVTVVADPASTHERKGYVTHHLPDAALHGGNLDLYLCGPPPMVDAVRGTLAERGVKPANFHFEKFNPSEAK